MGSRGEWLVRRGGCLPWLRWWAVCQSSGFAKDNNGGSIFGGCLPELRTSRSIDVKKGTAVMSRSRLPKLVEQSNGTRNDDTPHGLHVVLGPINSTALGTSVLGLNRLVQCKSPTNSPSAPIQHSIQGQAQRDSLRPSTWSRTIVRSPLPHRLGFGAMDLSARRPLQRLFQPPALATCHSGRVIQCDESNPRPTRMPWWTSSVAVIGTGAICRRDR